MAEKKTVTKIVKNKGKYSAYSGTVKPGAKAVRLTKEDAPMRAQSAARRGNEAAKRQRKEDGSTTVTKVVKNKDGYRAVSGTKKAGQKAVALSDRNVPMRAQAAARRGNAAKKRGK